MTKKSKMYIYNQLKPLALGVEFQFLLLIKRMQDRFRVGLETAL